MGPIEHAVCQIAFKVEKKYNDKEFVNQILQIATLIHNVEIAPKDWETNQDIRELHTLGHNIRKEIEITFNEEMKEITWATGVEYVFQNSFALRTGYFNESLEKGSRRFLTLGAGFQLDFAAIDISYLFSTSRIRNPLENTLRFSLNFKGHFLCNS